MDVKTARKYLADGRLPSEKQTGADMAHTPRPVREGVGGNPRTGGRQPGLEAKTIFEALQRNYPGEFADGQLRTLQRQLKRWRATEGPGREVFFAQQHVPGRLGQSDFTHMNEAGRHHRRAEFSAHAVPLRADVLELGRRHAVLLGEF